MRLFEGAPRSEASASRGVWGFVDEHLGDIREAVVENKEK
jgi:hypothetical protein